MSGQRLVARGGEAAVQPRSEAQPEPQAVVDFSGLFREYGRDLYRFALFLGGDPALADDIVSETFVRLWGARERVDFQTVKGYLFTIARNVFLHERRRARATDPLDPDLEDRRPGPESEALARAELRQALAALQALPEIDRTAFLMRIDGGLAYDEIAASLGLSAAAARVKVHRARLKLAATDARRNHLATNQEKNS
jgi:RNA polymerase sigma-70 factor (ECF subfamily)